MDCNTIPSGRDIVKVFSNRSIGRKLAALDEDHYATGNKLLSYRRDLENGFGRSEFLALNVRIAVPLGFDYFPILKHSNCKTRNKMIFICIAISSSRGPPDC